MMANLFWYYIKQLPRFLGYRVHFIPEELGEIKMH